jgi:hypothetical protein
MTRRRKAKVQQQALQRAVENSAISNYPAIYEGFAAKGIAADDIKPRENVFTFESVPSSRPVCPTRRAWGEDHDLARWR